MAHVWSTFLRLVSGNGVDQSPRLEARASLGSLTRPKVLKQVGESLCSGVGTLRVGFPGNIYWSEPLVRCSISTPDNGIQLENIDVPLTVAVPLPVNIRVFLVGELPINNTIELVASASIDVDSACDWGPTRTDSVIAWAGAGSPVGTILLEPWCQAVTLHAPLITGDWLDAGFVSLGAFDGYRPRPRAAVAVGPSAPTLITQHYAT